MSRLTRIENADHKSNTAPNPWAIPRSEQHQATEIACIGKRIVNPAGQEMNAAKVPFPGHEPPIVSANKKTCISTFTTSPIEKCVT
jgi:hypothetical protein